MKSAAPALFIQICRHHNLPDPIPEYRFHPGRRWRIDYYFEHNGRRVALEVEGGIWTKGRHTRPAGFQGDMEKYNALACMGILLLRVAPADLMKTSTMQMIQTALLTKQTDQL